MKHHGVKKLAHVLKVMVIVVLVCNIITLFFVPGLALMRCLSKEPQVGFMETLLVTASDIEDLSSLALVSFMNWNPLRWISAAMHGGSYWTVLIIFLLVCGTCTALILWHGRRVLDNIINEKTFAHENADCLKRVSVCCFVISGSALVRLVWCLAYFRMINPLLTYNALFVPLFLMGGLLFLIMSALFRQAAELKEENDLTI